VKKFINNLPIVSVIITTKNEEGNIQKCIESINKQTYPSLNIEIIVIDNYSTDKTIQIVKHLTNKLKNLSIKLYSHGNERSAQRNYGAEKAHGKYYLYLDADMILSPNVIKECVLNIKNLHGLYIPEIIQGDSFWNKVRKFERTFYDKTVIDCVRFLPLSILKRVGGFDESLIGP